MPGSHPINRAGRARTARSVAAAIAIALVTAGCSSAAEVTTGRSDGEASATEDGRDADAPLVIATTVAPLTSITSAVVGDLATVTGIVPEGTNSHTFEPPPSAAEILSEADIVFLNGLQLEEPTKELAETNRKEGNEIVELGTQTITADEYRYDDSFPEDEGKPNPHLWTNPPMVKRYAEIIRDTVIERDPDNTEAYRANTDRYLGALDRLDAAMRAGFATIPADQRKLLTYHDAYA
jgi:ABC-type Zn uptake system ZnuABC Zn-binding protein ZnuA